jgi:hypothetical protein
MALIIAVFTSNGQIVHDEKRDYVWLRGPSWLNTAASPSTFIEFNGSAISFSQTPCHIPTNLANSTICDTAGNFLFGTNGFKVINRNGVVMPNGDSLGYGNYYQNCQITGLRVIKGVLILPLPGSDSLYYIFHYKISEDYISSSLLYSIVSSTRDNGYGDVISKNNRLISEPLLYGGLTATRHANGRDWWLIVPQPNEGFFYRILLDPEGVHILDQQTIGPVFTIRDANSAFSPDGTKYFFLNDLPYNTQSLSWHTAGYFNFDRTTGILSNFTDFSFYDSTSWAFGASFSPDSRFIYISVGSHVYQWDTWAGDLSSSAKIVGQWDGFTWFSQPVVFGTMQAAPDGKIYIDNQGTPYLSVINQPNQPGPSCNLVQRAYNLSIQGGALPNLPDFRLGAVVGIEDMPNLSCQPCSISVYPNPANTYTQFRFVNMPKIETPFFEISNSLGIIVAVPDVPVNAETLDYDVSLLPDGIYFARLKSDKFPSLTSKFVVSH